MNKKRNETIKIVVAVIVLYGSYYFVEDRIRHPRTSPKVQFVERELKSISDPPGVRKNRMSSDYGFGTGGAKQTFTSDIDYEEIRSFYQAQLQGQGWTFVCANVAMSRNKMIFSRDEYIAVLDLPEYSEQLFPPHAHYQYSFGFSLEIDWGTRYECSPG